MKVAAPIIYNVAMATAGTEYSQTLGTSTETFLIQCRTLADLWLSFTAGQSGTKYITIPSGSNYEFVFGWVGTRTLYFQSPTANVVAEILAWS